MKPDQYFLISNRGLIYSFAIVFISCCVRCADQAPTKTCSDPLGSQSITINNNTKNYNNSFFCFKGETVTNGDTCLYNYCFRLFSSASPQIIWSTYFKGCSYGTITDVGLITCLGEVVHKPASGYAYAVNPLLHHGYVVHFPDSTYGRFFIDSWVKESSEVTVMNIVRQYPF
jgi:hypothetical protein